MIRQVTFMMSGVLASWVALAAPAQTKIIAWGGFGFAYATNVPASLTNAVAISSSGYPAMALRSDGTAELWAQPIGTTPFATNASVSNIVKIDSGYVHILAQKQDGTLVAQGAYGDSINLAIAPVATPPPFSNVVAFSAGGLHDVALLHDGRVVVWGLSAIQTNVPPDLGDVIAIDTGRRHTLALKRDGTVAAWGSNDLGQINIPPGLSSVIAIAAGHFFNVALRRTGELVGWGDNRFGQLDFPSDATNVVAISAGRNHCLAQRADGSLIAWGDNTYTQTNVPAGLSNILAFSAGGYHNLVLTGPSPLIYPTNPSIHVGHRVTFGVTARGQGPLQYQWRFKETDIPGATGDKFTITNVQLNDAGPYTVVVTDKNGSVTTEPAVLNVLTDLFITQQPTNQTTHITGTANFRVTPDGARPFYYQWRFEGTNISGATNETLTLSNLSSRMAGSYSVMVSNHFGAAAVSSNATLTLFPIATWGTRAKPLPVGLSNLVAISTQHDSNLGLTSNGTVVGWGEGVTPVPPNVTNIIAISAGRGYGLGLTADRTVIVWGSPLFSGPLNLPPDLGDVIAISAGNSHALALKADGTVVGWGDRDPVPEGLSNVVEIATGTSLKMALKSDGTIVAWGSSSGLPRPTTPDLTNIVAIATHGSGFALTHDGLVIEWAGGSSTVVSNFANLIDIAPGPFHLLGLREDTTVGVRGGNLYGVTNLPLGLTNVLAIAAGLGHSIALITEDPAAFAPPTIRPVIGTNTFAVSFPTRRGWRYRLEYKDSLADDRWTMLPPIPGDGAVQIATDPNPPTQQRFYRLRQLH